MSEFYKRHQEKATFFVHTAKYSFSRDFIEELLSQPDGTKIGFGVLLHKVNPYFFSSYTDPNFDDFAGNEPIDTSGCIPIDLTPAEWFALSDIGSTKSLNVLTRRVAELLDTAPELEHLKRMTLPDFTRNIGDLVRYIHLHPASPKK